MKNYVMGNITFSDNSNVEIECNNVGYSYNVVCKIPLDSTKIYLYKHSTEYECVTYAFSCEFDRRTFISLLSIKGVGLATIRNIYSRYDTEQICNIVNNKDINQLLLINGIGKVIAQTILGTIDTKSDKYLEKEITLALKSFGYSLESIKTGITYIDYSLNCRDNIAIIIKKL